MVADSLPLSRQDLIGLRKRGACSIQTACIQKLCGPLAILKEDSRSSAKSEARVAERDEAGEVGDIRPGFSSQHG